MNWTTGRVRFLLGLAVGLGAGLLYGWLLQPVEFVDTSPDSLRRDYRADYVLMVAEAYQADNDVESARRRLAVLGPQLPAVIAGQALEFAGSQSFAEGDLELMAELQLSLEQRQASPEIGNP